MQALSVESVVVYRIPQIFW